MISDIWFWTTRITTDEFHCHILAARNILYAPSYIQVSAGHGHSGWNKRIKMSHTISENIVDPKIVDQRHVCKNHI